MSRTAKSRAIAISAIEMWRRLPYRSGMANEQCALSQIAHSRTIQPRLKALDVARVTPLRC
jgi:hypothetical protein